MAYTKTTWINDAPPALNQTNLNHAETGIGDAHDLVAAETAARAAADTGLDTRVDALETGAAGGGDPALYVFGPGNTVLSAGTVALDMTGKLSAIYGGTLAGNVIINVTGTFQWGAGIRFWFQQVGTGSPFTLTFARNGVSTSPTVRWGGGAPPSPIMNTALGALVMFTAVPTPGGNLVMFKMPDPIA